MLHYYAYYSVGGYKDMYLGNSGMANVDKTYYMPLLSKMKVDANSVAEKERVAELEKLTTIEVLTAKDRKGLPVEADTLVTHGCYTMIYTHLTGSKYIITIRDIKNADADENGRSIPFLLSIMSDASEDLPLMNRMASFFSSDIKKVSDTLSSMIHYDMKANGICFELYKMNNFVKGIKSEPVVRFVDGKTKTVAGVSGGITLLMLPSGIAKSYALKELNMGNVVKTLVSEVSLTTVDGRSIRGLQNLNVAIQPKLLYILLIVGAVGIAGILLYCLLNSRS